MGRRPASRHGPPAERRASVGGLSCAGTPGSAPCEGLQELPRRDDRDTEGLRQHQQVRVSCDDEFGVRRERAAKDFVVFRIATSLFANGGGLNLVGLCHPPVQDRPRVARKFAPGLDAASLADELIQQAHRSENDRFALCGRHETMVGLVPPTSTREDDIRVEDGPHFRRLR